MSYSEKFTESSKYEKYILLDDFRRPMMFNGNEDFQYHLRRFRAQMKVEGHECVTGLEGDLVPVRPDECMQEEMV